MKVGVNESKLAGMGAWEVDMRVSGGQWAEILTAVDVVRIVAPRRDRHGEELVGGVPSERRAPAACSGERSDNSG